MALLEVKDLYKNFGNVEVLKGISFSLEKGQTLSLIGPSGGGKTTLLRCMNFLEIPTKGKITVNNKVIYNTEDEKRYTDEEIRQNRLHFGLVFQAFGIICVGSGASLTLNMHIIPNPGDFMVNAAAYRMHKPLGFAKNVVDISIVLSAIVLALIFHKNILQAGVGIGTIAAMFLVGRVMALISMLLSDKLREIYKNAHIGWLDDRPETIEVAK